MGVADRIWMQQAYHQALQAKARGEVPVGAVLVDSNNQLLSAAGNEVIQRSDPTAHAEILVLRDAALKINNYRLEQTTLYVTLEPCCMCAGALAHARVNRIVYATRDIRAGAAGSVYNLLHKIQLDEGIMQAECAALLTDFFQQRRG
jgi:tRNA(adenine34) deaminase